MSSIILNEGQKKGVLTIEKRVKQGERISIVAGYAGTGKTSIVKHMVDELNFGEHVAYVTFTGKASLVLTQKGIQATTIHKLIYDTKINPRTKKPVFILKEKKYLSSLKLIVIDEVSMVSEAIMKDLVSFGIPIIGIGDPFQLPPIGRELLYLHNPHVFLTEIHRQAAENRIIWGSFKLRNKEKLPWMTSKELSVIPHKHLQESSMLAADQILCGYNKTRVNINAQMRKLKGLGDGLYPVEGDKIICLSNDWDTVKGGYPLVNGMIGTAHNPIEDTVHLMGGYGKMRFIKGTKEVVKMDFKPDFSDGWCYNVNADKDVFKRVDDIEREKDMHYFDFADAITVHKSQGSEFPKVLIFEEVLNSAMHWRWLYTALTRAGLMAIIVRRS